MESKMFDHPFNCEECQKHSPTEFKHFEPTDVWLIGFPEKKLLHLHFGVSTSSVEESTAETKWVQEIAENEWFTAYPNTKFATLVDLTRSDDGEFPSQISMKSYKEMLRHPQNGLTVFYGATHSMKMLLTLLLHGMHHYKHVHIVETKQEANELYKEWFKNQS